MSQLGRDDDCVRRDWEADVLRRADERYEQDIPDYDPGPEVDDEGGMSEYRYMDTDA